MILNIAYKKNWLSYYQSGLAIVAVFFFFTRLDTYLVIANIANSPIGWILPYIILCIPVFVLKKFSFPSLAVFLWCLSYLLITFIYYTLFPVSEFSSKVLLERSFATGFLIATVVILADSEVLIKTRYALLVATLIGVLNNLFQFFNPSAFLGLVEGRATGLYLDPNDCASALTLGMIFTLDLLKPKYRMPWVLTVGLGVALTLSRGGLLTWMIVVIAFSVTRLITVKQLMVWILGISMCLFLFIQMELQADGSGILELLDSNALGRLESITEGSTIEDPAAIERQEVAKKAWELFLERPLLGNGIGAMQDYTITGFTVSSHNMFLLYLAEYGFLGIFILPLIIYASLYSARGSTRKLGTVFALCVLLSSLFAHTILDMRHYLMMFAVMTVMSVHSQTSSPIRTLKQQS